MLLNCGAGEDSWESLELQGDQTSQFQRKPTLNIHWTTDAKAEASILWPLDVKNWVFVKDPGANKTWGQEKKRVIEDEMLICHQWLNGHEFEQNPGDSEGQGNLMFCSPWGHKESDMTKATYMAHFHVCRQIMGSTPYCQQRALSLCLHSSQEVCSWVQVSFSAGNICWGFWL